MIGNSYLIEVYAPMYDNITNTLTRRIINLNTEVLKLYGINKSILNVGEYASEIHVVDKLTQTNDLCNPHILTFIYESDDKVKDAFGNVYDVETISTNSDYLFEIAIKKQDNSNFTIKNFGVFAHSVDDIKMHPKNILLKGFKLGDKEWQILNGINNILTFDVPNNSQNVFKFYFTLSGKKISNESEIFGLTFLLEV